MITKIGARSADPADLVAYLGGPGNLDEHINPQVVAASIGQTGPLDKAMQAQVNSDLRLHAQIHGDKGKHIQHYTVAIGSDEGQLPPQKWAAISRDWARGMELDGPGVEPCQWVSVHHGSSAKGNDHVHVVASLVRADGTRASTSYDGYRAKDIAIALEDKYGLKPLPGRRLGQSQRPDSQKDLARARDQGLPESRRAQIERTVRAAASVVSTVDEFEQILKANGLDFHPYKSAAGTITGYSVSTPETRTKAGVVHRWAGGKLARDLSLPRLQMAWKSNASTKPTHIRAVQELQQLQRALPTADALALEDASHQLAGALAAASVATEDPPGELAAASKQAGAYAQTVRASVRPKPPALGVGALFLFATDPTGPSGKAVMIMQLMAAYRALLDAQFARRGLVTTRERIPSMAGQAGPEEEMLELGVTTGLTTGALLLEHHARAKEAAAKNPAPPKPQSELWDAKKIREMRKSQEAAEAAKTSALKPPLGTEMITPDQLAKASALAKEVDMPSVATLAESLTAREAELYLAEIEAKVVRPVTNTSTPMMDPESFEEMLEAKHGAALTPAEEYVEKYATPQTEAPDLPYGGPGQRPPQGPAERLAAEVGRTDTWKSGEYVPSTELQVLWLTRNGGLPEEVARRMSKSGADSYRRGVEKSQGLTPSPKARKPPPPGKGSGIGK